MTTQQMDFSDFVLERVSKNKCAKTLYVSKYEICCSNTVVTQVYYSPWFTANAKPLENPIAPQAPIVKYIKMPVSYNSICIE